jgi:hypothetical protein
LEKSELPKFYHISRYQINKQIDKTIVNSNSENVIVYFLFWNLYYVKFAYLSLYSLLKNTDAADYDIKIITHFNIEKEVREIFEPILGPNGIIVHTPYKYDIFNHPYIKSKKKVCFMDADGFIDSKERTNLFSDLFNSEKIVMCKELESSVEEMLEYRSGILRGCENLIDKSKIKDWYLAGLSVYDNSIFDEDYVEYSQKFINFDTSDDEVVLLNYFGNKYEIKNTEEIIKWSRGAESLNFTREPFFSQYGDRLFVHPIQDEFSTDKFIPNYFNKILQ